MVPADSHTHAHSEAIYRNSYISACIWASLLAQRLKRLPAMQEIQVRSLGGEDPLEEETATHSNILAWEIPWTEEPGRLQSVGSQKNQTGLSTHAPTHAVSKHAALTR